MNFKQSDIVLLHGDPAVATFDMLEKLFVDLRPEIDKARVYARSSSPVLIEAGAGPELEMLAQAIHNGSDRKKNSYAVISLSGTTNEEQNRLLFGDPRMGRQGAILDSNHGTLMIQGIDKLTLPMQSQLARVIRTKRVMSQTNYSQYRYVDVRIITSTSKNLTKLRNQLQFRSDLLFTFRALRLRIPKLKDRPNDVTNMLDFYFNDFNTQYKTCHTLTKTARDIIINYPWESTISQLSAFCERMILTAPESTISGTYVRTLLQELYEQDSAIYDSVPADNEIPAPVGSGQPAAFSTSHKTEASQFSDLSVNSPMFSGSVDIPMESFQKKSTDPYRDLIIRCLRENNGNRKTTAAQLGISTTTLWRKLKHYQLEDIV